MMRRSKIFVDIPDFGRPSFWRALSTIETVVTYDVKCEALLRNAGTPCMNCEWQFTYCFFTGLVYKGQQYSSVHSIGNQQQCTGYGVWCHLLCGVTL